MLEKIKGLLEKYKSLIRYGIFGVLTTALNIFTYTFFYQKVGISNVASNVFAWIAGVLFAFVTNKLWVFESKSVQATVLIREMISFFGCRLATGMIDLAIMYVTVDRFALNSTAMKCISNAIVIVGNYAASRLFIFKDEKKE